MSAHSPVVPRTRKRARKRPKQPTIGCVRCVQYKSRDDFDEAPSGRKRVICRDCDKEETEAKAARPGPPVSTRFVDGVEERRCCKCKDWKPVKGPNAGFHKGRKGKNGRRKEEYWCKGCKRDYAKGRYRQQRADEAKWEAERELRNARQREWRHNNPVLYAAQQTRYMEKLRADKARHQAWLEGQRIGYRIRREKKGLGLETGRRCLKGVEGCAQAANTGHRLSGGPLRVWLELVIAHEAPTVALGSLVDPGVGIDGLAEDWGIEPRQMFRIRTGESDNVSLSIVDRMLQGYNTPVFIRGKDLEGGLREMAMGLPGNGTRLLRYLDHAEEVAHLDDATVWRLEDLYTPEQLGDRE